MSSPNPRIIKRGCSAVTLSLLSIAVIIVLTIFFGLLFDLFGRSHAAPTPVAALTLPPAVVATATVGPPLPDDIYFTPQQPIKGFSNCETYGFRGVIQENDTSQETIQIVVWDESAALVALETADNQGSYTLEFSDEPLSRDLWLQVYQNDLPVSEPLPLKIHVDCQNGFQVYEINWQAISPESNR